jgi:hypothetical protein
VGGAAGASWVAPTFTRYGQRLASRLVFKGGEVAHRLTPVGVRKGTTVERLVLVVDDEAVDRDALK